jgi:2-dehydropantoate 2-reductase
MGAIGCAYGSKLYDWNPSALRVIAGGERAEKYKRDGFLVNGRHYSFPCISPEEETGPADLVILAVKSYQLPEAIRHMKNQVGKDTIIVSLLNGISSEEILAETFGPDHVLYAMCVSIDANREGNSVTYTSLGTIVFGERQNRVLSPQVKAVMELFEKASIPYRVPEDMYRELWWKYMINVGINQCSAVLRGRYGLFQSNEYARQLMESAMREVIQLSHKTGANLSEDDLARWYDVLHALNPASRTSMLEDVENGRVTEVDAFSGTVCRLGEKYGVETPVNRTLYYMIKAMEPQNR